MTERCETTVQDGESSQAVVDEAESGDTICVETGTDGEDVGHDAAPSQIT